MQSSGGLICGYPSGSDLEGCVNEAFQHYQSSVLLRKVWLNRGPLNAMINTWPEKQSYHLHDWGENLWPWSRCVTFKAGMLQWVAQFNLRKIQFFMVCESQLGDSSKVVKILEFKAGVSQWVTRWKSVHCLDMRRWSLMGSLQKVIRETIWRQMVPGLCSFWVCGDGAWEPSKKIAVKQSEDRWSLANPATSQPQSLLEIRKNT